MIVLVQLDVQAQALVLVSQLYTRGVSCERTATGGILVEPDDFETAFGVLVEAELVATSPWTGEACPNCKGHQVRNMGVDWKHASWGFLLLTTMLLGLPLFWRKRHHHCLGCGKGWESAR